jgi:hypothetical protein
MVIASLQEIAVGLTIDFTVDIFRPKPNHRHLKKIVFVQEAGSGFQLLSDAFDPRFQTSDHVQEFPMVSVGPSRRLAGLDDPERRKWKPRALR